MSTVGAVSTARSTIFVTISSNLPLPGRLPGRFAVTLRDRFSYHSVTLRDRFSYHSAFDQSKADQMIAERDLEALEMYTMEVLLKG
jgi:hypothetical protein